MRRLGGRSCRVEDGIEREGGWTLYIEIICQGINGPCCFHLIFLV